MNQSNQLDGNKKLPSDDHHDLPKGVSSPKSMEVGQKILSQYYFKA